MIAAEDITKTKILEGVTPEQIAAIVTLSQNADEDVRREARRKVYEEQETAIFEASGLKKEPNEKASAYAARAIAQFKTEAEAGTTLKGQIDTLKAEKKTLEDQIRDGKGDEGIRKNLKDVTSELDQLKVKYKSDLEAKDKLFADKENELKLTTIRSELDKSKIGLKFKDEKVIPKEAREALINQVDQMILSEYTIDFVENANGKKTVLRDKDNEIVRNPDNLNEPMTILEVYNKRLVSVIETGVKQNGLSSKTEKVSQNGTFTVNAKNQSEAMEQIREHLIGQGIQRGSSEFTAAQNKIWSESQVEKLPVQ